MNQTTNMFAPWLHRVHLHIRPEVTLEDIEEGLIVNLYGGNQLVVVENPSLYKSFLEKSMKGDARVSAAITVHVRDEKDFAMLGLRCVNFDEIPEDQLAELFSTVADIQQEQRGNLGKERQI